MNTSEYQVDARELSVSPWRAARDAIHDLAADLNWDGLDKFESAATPVLYQRLERFCEQRAGNGPGDADTLLTIALMVLADELPRHLVVDVENCTDKDALMKVIEYIHDGVLGRSDREVRFYAFIDELLAIGAPEISYDANSFTPEKGVDGYCWRMEFYCPRCLLLDWNTQYPEKRFSQVQDLDEHFQEHSDADEFTLGFAVGEWGDEPPFNYICIGCDELLVEGHETCAFHGSSIDEHECGYYDYEKHQFSQLYWQLSDNVHGRSGQGVPTYI